MRNLTAAACTLLLTTTIAATPAHAARPQVTQAEADTIARDYLDTAIQPITELLEPGDTWATSYELDPCDIGRRRAYCDYTLRFNDGDACDGSVIVQRTRRGRLVSEMVDEYCDSDDVSGQAAGL